MAVCVYKRGVLVGYKNLPGSVRFMFLKEVSDAPMLIVDFNGFQTVEGQNYF